MLPLVAAGCYRPIDVAHCAITCDPLVGNCPGSLICGTDSFCHTATEPLNNCLAGVIDAPPHADAFIFPHDGPPDALVLPIDAAACSSQWRADFDSDPTIPGAGNHWMSSGAVPFNFATQVTIGTWNAPDMSALQTTPGMAFQGETLIDADVDLPQVGDALALSIGLTDGAQFAQLSVALGHPTAGTESLVVTNSYGAAQPEMLLGQTAAIGAHHVHVDVQWPTGIATLKLDGGAASPLSFMKGAGSLALGTVALSVTTSANINTIAVCVP